MTERRRAPVMLVAVGLVAATLVLSRATDSWVPMWGAPALSGWSAALTVVCALVGLVGGVVLIVRARPQTERAPYYLGTTGAALALAIPLWVGLGQLVGLLAVVLTVPYAVGLVGLIAWVRRRQ